MKKPLGKIFTFSKNERNGIIVLLLFIAILIAVDFYVESFSESNVYDFSEFEKEISAFERSLVKDNPDKYRAEGVKENIMAESSEKESYELFHFDPNHTTNKDWKKLGLKSYQIKIINNYLEKGGRFYKKEDMKKIYGLSNNDYERLENYIEIPDEKKPSGEMLKRDTVHKKRPESMLTKVELNAADTIQLMLIHGIGSIFAERICRYRNLLGGYREIEQLKEVYGFNDTVYQNVKRYFKLDTNKCNKININTAQFSELIRHPYLNKYQTKSILKYREIKGEIKKVRELKKYNILSDKSYIKMKDYLSCE